MHSRLLNQDRFNLPRQRIRLLLYCCKQHQTVTVQDYIKIKVILGSSLSNYLDRTWDNLEGGDADVEIDI